ncbi:uncharacterized protein C3orf18 homolog isoform X1 [Ischnura elegans]|uniref:uncharacterized protein C3orf18 homolog isoform X1 n=2 Tax=Ischnura elegans TaxID=197161 RepID=UPI001ED8AB27|nr:uncharacterized protein C3orf18 homolog isoform X1 [Ischnura elegans]
MSCCDVAEAVFMDHSTTSDDQEVKWVVTTEPQVSNSTTNMSTITYGVSSPLPLPDASDMKESGLSYLFVPIGLLMFIVGLSGVVWAVVRKRRLDHLRHHLMPLYTFDPADEGEDWEAELLEEGPTGIPGAGSQLTTGGQQLKGYESMESSSKSRLALYSK